MGTFTIVDRGKSVLGLRPMMPPPAWPTSPLPVDSVLPGLLDHLSERAEVVLEAPPGAGKTTRIPLALLTQPWVAAGRILVVEPRRIAARSAAARMATMLGEPVGETVGYRVRMETKTGPGTRIEVVTAGIYLRQLQADPTLDGISAVLFDEVHERRLDTDLVLALTLDARQLLRPELRLIAMSATLDRAGFASLLGDAPVVQCDVPCFPVTIRHVNRRGPLEGIEKAVAAAVVQALEQERGSVLVFLPGWYEIRSTARLLADRMPADVTLTLLHGELDLDQQLAAIRPMGSGRRKVVLATSVAESSLTIDGVLVVIDSGLTRVARFDPVSGMGRLETVRVSLASARQRAGRAGRLEPGVCWRLWPEAEDLALPATSRPEILDADLAPLALELALWGSDPSSLRWIDPPPVAAMDQGQALLQRLGALDDTLRVTDHGRAMARIGLHPRLAHMVLEAGRLDQTVAAACLAALLEEGARSGGWETADLSHRLESLAAHSRDGEPSGDRRILMVARQICRAAGFAWPAGRMAANTAGMGILLAMAYPDRIAKRRGPPGIFHLANGRGAMLDTRDPLAKEEWLAVAGLKGGAANARIRSALPITGDDVETYQAGRIITELDISWDQRRGAVVAYSRRRLDAIILDEHVIQNACPAQVADALLSGIRKNWPHCLSWPDSSLNLRARVALCRTQQPDGLWPDWSHDRLLASLETWLRPWIFGLTRRDQLASIDLAQALASTLDPGLQRQLDQLAPDHVRLVGGRTYRLDYTSGVPVLAIKLQDMFGTRETPRIFDGRLAVVVHLLSPAGRPVQVTSDLQRFWVTGYASVRAALRARYPKHFWPEDPLTAGPPPAKRPQSAR